MNRRLSHRLVPLVVGTVVIMLLASQAFAQPDASAYLYQSGGWSSPQASGSAPNAVVARRLISSDSSSLWVCEVWARSSADWLIAEAQAILYVDGRNVATNTFYPNYWGNSQSASAWVEAGLQPKSIYCEAYVSDLLGNFDAGVGAELPARAPADLRSVPPDQWTYTAPGDYLKIRIWQIWDNYGLPWTYAHFPVTEYYEYPTNGCGIFVKTGAGPTNNEGRFQDKYGNFDGQSTFRCTSPCQTDSIQHISVGGAEFSHSVTWRCNDVTIGRQ